jgi:hypothetical protein
VAPLGLAVLGFASGIAMGIAGIISGLPALAFFGVLLVWWTQHRALARRCGNATWRRFRRYAVSSQGRALFSIRAFVGIAAVAQLAGPKSIAVFAAVVFLVVNVAVVDSIRRSYGTAFRSDVVLGANEQLDSYLQQWRWFDTTSRPFDDVLRRLRTAVDHGAPVLWLAGLVAALLDEVTVLGVAAVAVAVVGVVALLFDVANITVAVRKKVYSEQRRRTLEIIAELKPQIAVYFSATSPDALYQIAQWIPTLEATGRSIVIITREHQILPFLDELSATIPAVCVPALSSLESIAPDSLSLVCYVNNAVKNGHMVRRIELTHVQLLHGESDKQSSVSRASTAYDRVAVAGQAAIDRYGNQGINLPPEQYMVVGRPVTDVLHRGPTDNTTPCVLYAPTWEGHDDAANTSSVSPAAANLVTFLLREYPGVRLLFKPHPFTGTRNPLAAAVLREIREAIDAANEADPAIGHQYLSGPQAPTLYEAFDACDVLLADVSSVIADFLATDRPMIVLDTAGIGSDELSRVSPTTRGAAIVPVAPTPFSAALDDALGPDSRRHERLDSRRYVLGDFEGSATDKFCTEIDLLLDAAAAPVEPSETADSLGGS